MQITLQITAESPAEMMKVLAAFEKAQLADQPEFQFPPSAAQNGGATPKRRGRPPREMNKLEEVPAPKLQVVEATPEKIVIAPVPETEPEPEPAPPKQEITIVEVRNALTQFLARTDQKQASALLLQYGKTDRLSKLKREQFEAVYNAAMTPAAKTDVFDDEIPF